MTRRSLLAVTAVLGMLFALLPFAAAGAAPAPDIFISEYVEGGSGNNKAIEIYNGTNGTVDLSGYTLERYSNGSTSGTTIALAGSVAPGDVWVIVNGSADPGLLALADQTSGSVSHNGDDAYTLLSGTTVIDSFGEVGFDPGSAWSSNGVSSRDDSLRRIPSVCSGDALSEDPFDPSIEWTAHGDLVWDGLGSHTSDCGPDGSTTTSSTTSSTTTTMAPPSGVVDVLINEVDADTPGTDVAEFIEIVAVSGGVEDLTGLSIVLYNGSDDLAYDSFDLDGLSTGADGYFVICGDPSEVPNCDLDGFNSNGVQNGADAVVLVSGDASEYPNDAAQPAESVIVDAIVYDTSDSDDAGLLGLINTGQPQVNEAGAGDKDNHSNQRCPDASGGNRNTDTYEQWLSTPGAENVCEIVVPPAQPYKIHEVQGSGAASPLDGAGVIVEGVVTADYQGFPGLGGFFMQEEDSEVDSDPSTSEGIFVFQGGSGFVDVAVGDVVSVTGIAEEFFDHTQIGNVTEVVVTGTGSVSATSVTLPLASADALEALEGMKVEFAQTLFVTETFTLGRFGEVVLSSSNRLDNPTNVANPGTNANALQAANDLNRIQLDDGVSWSNFDPTPYLGMGGTLRGGDSTTGLTGVIGYSFGNYEIQPVGPVSFTRVNERPSGPPAVGGDVTVASFNVLNYFSTIDTGSPICGPAGDDGCRGADTVEEFDLQRTKIINAIVKLDADVVGLMEIENHATDDALADLLAGLNAAAGAGTYAAVETGAVGDDAIKVALIYQPERVTPSGAFAILDESVDPRFLDAKNRPVVAQTFTENGAAESFTVAVNHLKSKGSPCDDVGDVNANDGQGNCNGVRTAAAEALVDWLATDPTGSGDPDALIIGDLNSYAMEDPIAAIEAGGYTDLIDAYKGVGLADDAYSYVFAGQWGYLDHALANGSMSGQVTGTAFWHINSDEPPALDYNNFNLPSNQTNDEFRSSDHDPVVIGLDLNDGGPDNLIEDATDLLDAQLPTGSSASDRFIRRAIGDLEDAAGYWDGTDATSSRYFSELARAARYVDLVERFGGLDDEAAEETLDQIADAARSVAAQAVDAAASGWITRIAERFLGYGDSFVARGNTSLGVHFYGAAWSFAHRAGVSASAL